MRSQICSSSSSSTNNNNNLIRQMRRPDVSKDIQHLLSVLFEVDPMKRISAREFLQLPFMKKTMEEFVMSYELGVNRTSAAAAGTSAFAAAAQNNNTTRGRSSSSQANNHHCFSN